MGCRIRGGSAAIAERPAICEGANATCCLCREDYSRRRLGRCWTETIHHCWSRGDTEEPEPADPSPKTQPNVYGPASPLAEATNLTVSLTTGAFGVKMKLVERTGGVPPVTGTVFRRHPQPSGLLAQSIAP